MAKKIGSVREMTGCRDLCRVCGREVPRIDVRGTQSPARKAPKKAWMPKASVI